MTRSRTLSRRRGRAPLVASLLLAAVGAPPAAAQEKPTLTPADYGRFERLGRAVLSPDGRWLAYEVDRVDEELDPELRVRRLEEDSTRVVVRGAHPVFSPDGRWLAWTVAPPSDEADEGDDDEEGGRASAGLLDLEGGEERSFDAVESLAFDAEGRFLALTGYAPEEPEGKGADVRLVDLADGSLTTFGNVAASAWSDTGSLLAMALATGSDEGNGVQLFDAGAGRLRSLDASASSYRGLAWREGAADLAILRSVEPASEDGEAYTALAWRGLDGDGAPRRLALDPRAAGLPDTLRVVAHRTPEWSGDGGRIALGLRPVPADEREAAAGEDAPEGEAGGSPGAPGDGDAPGEAPGGGEGNGDGADEEEKARVQIWHTADVRIWPQQVAAAERDSRSTLLAVWEPEGGRLVRVGTDLRATTELLGEGWDHALEESSEAYPWGERFGRPYSDVWVVDVATGERRRLLERVRYHQAGPAGRQVVSFDGADWLATPVDGGPVRNLTAQLPTTFADTAYDTPTDLPPPVGFRPAGWLEGDEAVLLHDALDVWRVELDGSGGRRLSDGAEGEVVHRVLHLDRDDRAFGPDDPVYASVQGRWSRREGYARLDPGGDAGGAERLLWLDAGVGGLQKADSANVMAWTVQDFDDPPDVFVGGIDLSGARQVTRLNPFADEFAWGRSELVDFESETGRRLQAVLLYPAHHEPGRRYPTIVYTYELLSPYYLHRWEAPSERDYYNFTAWTQQGYAVLLPDIVYRARDPGVSALEAVRPAVETVVEMGVADPDAVGLVGHSWGGYQATFLPTRTDLFAASVAGAPLTDFVSMMGAIHWNPGIAELSHWETGQARMEVPFWEDPEAHRRNSPIHGVQDLDTPLLMAFGDDDGVVDFDQGTEFYNFARRAGKQMVLLVYEGQDHGFRDEAAQRDYHRRILEWFGHYLKGEPAPRWITEGVSLEGLDAELDRISGGDGGRR